MKDQMEPAPLVRAVADRVRRLRRQRGWTAQQLADACAEAGLTSLTRGTIAKIESGVRQSVTADEVAVLARVLGVTQADLVPTDVDINLPAGPSEAGIRGRRFLGRELRKARVKTGMTQAAAAAVLGCGQAKINKIETTVVGLSMDELDMLLDAYDVDPVKADELRQLAAADDRQRPRPKSERRSPAFRVLSDLELDAHEILCWQSEGIPGPLQSELYLLRQVNADTKPPYEVTQLVREHQARTRIFTTDNPPHYRVILSESSLHRMPGGRSPELVLDQAEHLLTAMHRHPRLTLQILTFDAPIRYAHTNFVLVRFAGNEDDFVYLEDLTGGRIARQIEPFEEHWRELRSAALSPEDSVEYLHRLSKETGASW